MFGYWSWTLLFLYHVTEQMFHAWIFNLTSQFFTVQFGPVAETQQEGVLWIVQAQICIHTK